MPHSDEDRELLAQMGTDPTLWSREFARIHRMADQTDDVRAWFGNAIAVGFAAGQASRRLNAKDVRLFVEWFLAVPHGQSFQAAPGFADHAHLNNLELEAVERQVRNEANVMLARADALWIYIEERRRGE